MEPYQRPVLAPHFYPLWVKTFAVLIVIITVTSIAMSPKYIKAARELKLADSIAAQGDYDSSLVLYNKILTTIPDSRTTLINASIAFFSNTNHEDDEVGIYLLKDLSLNDSEWAKVSAVMPVEYQKYFETTPY